MAEPGRARSRRVGEPTLEVEAALWAAGVRLVAGVDEVGRGPLAGPVVAAAVVFDPGVAVAGVRDSKLLAPTRRRELVAVIRERARAVGIGVVDVADIDRWNILVAALEAMRRAIADLGLTPDHVLVDGNRPPAVDVPTTTLVGGDRRVHAIAAASIVAKEHRDGILRGLDEVHPGYGFARHVGYGTRAHLTALARLGPSPVHRTSFAPVRRLLDNRDPGDV